MDMAMADKKTVDVHIYLSTEDYDQLCDIVKRAEGKVSRKISKHVGKAVHEYIERNKPQQDAKSVSEPDSTQNT